MSRTGGSDCRICRMNRLTPPHTLVSTKEPTKSIIQNEKNRRLVSSLLHTDGGTDVICRCRFTPKLRIYVLPDSSRPMLRFNTTRHYCPFHIQKYVPGRYALPSRKRGLNALVILKWFFCLTRTTTAWKENKNIYNTST